MKKQGFTLIEIVIVLGISAVVLWQGSVAYGAHIRKIQVREQGRNFVVNLRKAQNDAITGNKPTGFCNGATDQIAGYQVDYVDATSYTVSAICSSGTALITERINVEYNTEFFSAFNPIIFFSPLGEINETQRVRFSHKVDSCVDNYRVDLERAGSISDDTLEITGCT